MQIQGLGFNARFWLEPTQVETPGTHTTDSLSEEICDNQAKNRFYSYSSTHSFNVEAVTEAVTAEERLLLTDVNSETELNFRLSCPRKSSCRMWIRWLRETMPCGEDRVDATSATDLNISSILHMM